MNKAFTLIELLIVVLIIGILAAIAVPQYQKAVVKSRFASIKQAAKSIVQAAEAFYLANGRLGDFNELDISVGQIKSRTQTKIDDNISCKLEGVLDSYLPKVFCYYTGTGGYIMFQQYLSPSGTSAIYCMTSKNATSDIYDKVCQNETNHSSYCQGGECYYIYE